MVRIEIVLFTQGIHSLVVTTLGYLAAVTRSAAPASAKSCTILGLTVGWNVPCL
jgi:hypothetical protein